MNEPLPHPDDRDPVLPERLRADLIASFGPAPRVSPETDARILASARAGFARRLRFRLLARAAGAVGAVAAAVTIFVFVKHHHWDPRPQPSVVATGTKIRPGDADRSGRVDILDAFVLAKKVESDAHPAAPLSAWEDVNGDGALDRRDVDQVAALAVALTPGNLQ
jgi:hypothetical protein